MLATYSFLTPRLACSARVARLALPSHLRPACAPVLQRWLPYEARSPLSTSRSVRAENTSQAVVDTIPQGDTIQIHRIPQGTTEDDIRALFAPSSGHILQVRRSPSILFHIPLPSPRFTQVSVTIQPFWLCPVRRRCAGGCSGRQGQVISLHSPGQHRKSHPCVWTSSSAAGSVGRRLRISERLQSRGHCRSRGRGARGCSIV